ncbi:hypothetical protein DFP72DRAFT_887757 [Ephemerocybe angulata]|uniref:Uncharacterized protein n=1 Tax=Ephemerocybe angulata TaxID=980116 RepID=A0A8H6I6Z0_9AGAR|nr:hypothetical protein DFP72DRAFT_887757 [Tulosesus angulatus]
MDVTEQEARAERARELQDIAEATLDLEFGSSDEGEGGEVSGVEDEKSESETEDEPDVEADEQTRKRRKLGDLLGMDPEWFPWPDRLTCTLDIMLHLPRSVFSNKQMDLFLWLLRMNGVGGRSSVKSFLRYCDETQKLYGVKSHLYEGSLGHRFYVNDLGQLLGQEMANPRVRANLHFYPEDSGKHLSEARQGTRWLHELPPELTTPYARLGDQVYYTFEPALLTGRRLCIPVRWFTRGETMYAQCWKMVFVRGEGGGHWRAINDPIVEVGAHEFLLSFPNLLGDMKDHPERYNDMPPVSRIEGMVLNLTLLPLCSS